MSNRLDPDQPWRFVWPGVGANGSERLSVDEKSCGFVLIYTCYCFLLFINFLTVFMRQLVGNDIIYSLQAHVSLGAALAGLIRTLCVHQI